MWCELINVLFEYRLYSKGKDKYMVRCWKKKTKNKKCVNVMMLLQVYNHINFTLSTIVIESSQITSEKLFRILHSEISSLRKYFSRVN